MKNAVLGILLSLTFSATALLAQESPEYAVLDEATLLSNAKGESKADKLTSALNEKGKAGWRLVFIEQNVDGFRTSSRSFGGNFPTQWSVDNSKIYIFEKLKK